MGTRTSSFGKEDAEVDFQLVWCQACFGIVHKESCLHQASEKRPLLDVVLLAEARCQSCYQSGPGWYVKYACGHVSHLDICYTSGTETCPELCKEGTLLDPGNLSFQLRWVRKNNHVNPHGLRLPAFAGGEGPLISLAARFLSGGGHLHLALHTDTDPQPFHLFPQDTLFPVCDTGNHLSRHLAEFLQRQLGLSPELPHGLVTRGSPFEKKCQEATDGLFFGYRPNRRVYLCFGQLLATLLTRLADENKNCAVVCFSGAYDYHRHLQRRPPSLTIPANAVLVQDIFSRHV